MEVEAVNAGRIAKIVALEGKIVEVKQPIAYIADEGVDIDAYLQASGSAAPEAILEKEVKINIQSQPAVESVAASSPVNNDGSRKPISPAARKLAAEKGIDLANINAGSGPGGRIITNDLANAAVAARSKEAPKMSKMRLAIAQQLTYSKQNIP
ncbi:MAG: E3 binding domain-containing protein, partial [Phycisphaerales bacterium]